MYCFNVIITIIVDIDCSGIARALDIVYVDTQFNRNASYKISTMHKKLVNTFGHHLKVVKRIIKSTKINHSHCSVLKSLVRTRLEDLRSSLDYVMNHCSVI